MLVYQKNKESFVKDVFDNTIADEISIAYKHKLGKKPPPSEYNSWQNSCNFMQNILLEPNIPNDCGISIEYNIPSTAKRIDFIISGNDSNRNASVIIIELKQWSSAEITSQDAIVKTLLGGGIRETLHPSYQAWSYAQLLYSFNTYVYQNKVAIFPCAYLHNCADDNLAIRNDFYKVHLENAPIFLKHDTFNLTEFIKSHVRTGDNGEIISKIEDSDIRPSRALADSLVSMLQGNQEFVLIDDQKMVYETVLNSARTQRDKKTVIIVEGGPGTGKSVVAINLLVQSIDDRKNSHYVTRNSAPREVYLVKLTGTFTRSHISNIFKGSGSYVDAKPNTFDLLVVDEAHRLNKKSGMFKNLGENQVKEIINAAKTSVFFVDEDQKIHIHDIGDIEEIEYWAEKHNAEVIKLKLDSQFRCGGSDGYISWIDNALDIKNTANYDFTGIDYDFRIFDNPVDMREAIIEANKINNKSRLLAGYCWDWVSKKSPELYDIVFEKYDFQMRWNLSDDGMQWIIKKESVNEIGCIHTCQGLELDYAGVIIGPDMYFEDEIIVTNVLERSKNDRTIFGIKRMLREDKENALKLGETIIKNTYRTLMTRGMKGCFIYCTDSALRDYLKLKSSKNTSHTMEVTIA